MHADQIIADAIVEMADKGKLEIGYVNDIAQHIYELKKLGQDVTSITLQRSPLGFHSPEVAEFVGRLVTVGLATQGSPVTITSRGLEWLKSIRANGTRGGGVSEATVK